MEKSQSTDKTQSKETLLSITNLKKYFPVAKSSVLAKQMYVRANDISWRDLWPCRRIRVW